MEEITFEQYQQMVQDQIQPLLDVVQSIALGDLDVEVEVPEGIEAISELGVGVEMMVDDIRAMIAEQTRAQTELERRARQLTIAAKISRAVSSILHLDELLPEVVELVRDGFDLYYAGVFLLDPDRRHAVLKAGTGEAGQAMLQKGHRLAVDEESMIGWCIVNQEARIALDVGQDAVQFKNPLLPDTHSELALPLIGRRELIGAMTIQSTEVSGFTEQDIVVLQTVADQLATAIENATLFETVQASLRELEATQRRYVREAWDEYVQHGEWPRPIGYAYDLTELAPTTEPAPEIPQTLAQKEAVVLSGGDGQSARLVAPIALRDEPIGAFVFGDPSERRQWSTDEVALVDTVANQIALALESARLFEETQAEAQRRALINEVLQVTSGSLDPSDLLLRAGRTISSRLNMPCAIFRWEPESDVLQIATIHDPTGAQVALAEETVITAEMDPILFRTLLSREQHLTSNVSGQVSGVAAELVGSVDMLDAVYAPLAFRERTHGVLLLGRQRGHPALDEGELSFLEVIAVNLSVSLENAYLYQQAVLTAERLAEVDRVKSQFLATMSHELRTPLNSIIGFSRVILKGIDGPLTDLQRQDLEAIYNSGQHLLRLINDILDISKIQAGKMELALEPLNIGEMIDAVISTVEALVMDRPIELQKSVPDDLPPVVGDSRRIHQVLLNLVSNATKFTEHGYINISASVDDEYVTLMVRDSGIGIPAEKLETIFEAFTQVDSSATRRFGGTGLGLAISRSMIELHGGRIWVESEMDVGSTFAFTLPVHGPQPEVVGETEQVFISDVAPEGRQTEGAKIVLCIDDDKGVLTLFKRYLNKQGYQVIALTDSTRAIDEARRVQPNAITLDVMMPNKDGWQVIQELKADPQTRHIPVIMCTIVGDKGRGMSLGAADYLVKPILEQELIQALERLDGHPEPRTVLVVDDQAEDRMLLRRIIEGYKGYKVIEASSGEQAILSVKNAPPDIIFLDLMMPTMDGFTVLEVLKSDQETRSIPIVVVTAKELTQDDRDILNNHIELLIQKAGRVQDELLKEIIQVLQDFESPIA